MGKPWIFVSGLCLPEFGFGENSMSMEWSYVWEDDDDVSFSYGLATWTGSMADEVGASELCLGWPIIETTVPAPGTLALLGLTTIGCPRRRR